MTCPHSASAENACCELNGDLFTIEKRVLGRVMITKDGSIVRVAPIVDTSAIRQAVLDEDGHIRELLAAEWGKFSWDEVRVFMHEYPVYVLPTTELLDVLDDLTCDYKTIEIGAGTGSIGRLLGIKMTDSYMQQDNEAVRKYYESLGQPIIK